MNMRGMKKDNTVLIAVSLTVVFALDVASARFWATGLSRARVSRLDSLRARTFLPVLVGGTFSRFFDWVASRVRPCAVWHLSVFVFE